MRRSIQTLPPGLDLEEDLTFLRQVTHENVITMEQLIYRQKSCEGNATDDEFSRLTMQEHWQAGLDDAVRSLRHRRWRERAHDADGIAV